MHNNSTQDFSFNDELFYSIQEFILHRIGVFIPINRKYLFENRLDPLAKQHHFSSIQDYFLHISNQNTRHPLYLEFIDIVTTHETSFFRHRKQLETFSFSILPEYLANKKEKSISIWSAGCSTGEELYSFAMLIHLHLRKFIQEFSITCIGTDISEKVISVAQEGLYPLSIIESIPEDYRNLYTVPIDDSTFSIANTVKNICSFKEDNLPNTLLPEESLFDFILCRNVLIYFDERNVKKSLQNIKTRLHNNGLLLIGHSEDTKTIQTFFTPSKHDSMICIKK